MAIRGRAAYRVQHVVDIGPKPIASGSVDEVLDTCRLREGMVTNPTGGAITFSASDRQGSPVTIIGPESIAASGGELSWVFDVGPYMQGGVTLTASAPGLVGWLAVEMVP